MTQVSFQQFIANYLSKGKHMQLATLAGEQPYLCTVSYVYDEAGNLYWMSSRSTRHSIELLAHPKTAVAIVPDPKQKLGAQLTGVASLVERDNIEKIHSLYAATYGEKSERLDEALSDSSAARAYYIFKPLSVKLHDEINFPTDPQQTVDMA